MENIPFDPEIALNVPPAPEVSLTPKRLKILGCLACKTDRGSESVPDAVYTIQQCTNVTKDTVNTVLNLFAEYNLAEIRPRTTPSPVGTKRPSTREHTITDAGLKLLHPDWQPCNEEQYARNNPFRSATPLQRSFLRCISCLITQGKEARVGDIAACNERPPAQVSSTLKRFISIGAFEKINASVKHRGKGWQDPKQYLPTEESKKYLPKPPKETRCAVANEDPVIRYNSLATSQQNVLCELGRLAGHEGIIKPQDLVNALDMKADTVRYALTRLEALGYITRQTIGERPDRQSVTITEQGQEIIDGHESHKQRLNRIQACISCAITRQILRGEEASTDTNTVSACQGVSEALVNTCAERLPGVELSSSSIDGVKRRKISLNRTVDPADVAPSCIATSKEKQHAVFAPLARDSFKVIHVFDSVQDQISMDWLKNVRHHRILTHGEELSLAKIIQDPNASPEAKNEAINTFVNHNVRLALKVANETRRFARAFLTFEDVLQAALIGITQAAKSFDPTKNFKFSGYAFQAAKNNIILETATAANIPKYLVWRLPSLQYHLDQYINNNGRSPNAIELSLAADIPLKYILSARAACALHTRTALVDEHAVDTSSRDAVLPTRFGDISVEDPTLALPASTTRLATDLTDFERAILAASFGVMDISYHEISSQYNISMSSVLASAKRVRTLMRHPYYGLASSIPAFEWQADAACFTTGHKEVVKTQARILKPVTRALCAQCPVRQQCYDLATAGTEPVTIGVWGGKSYVHFKD